MDGFEFSVDAFPLVVCVVRDKMTDDDYHAMFSAWETVTLRKERFVALVDLRMARSPSNPTQRAMIAAWLRKMDGTFAQYSLGSASVVTSALVRGAMTAVNWIHRPKVVQVSFGTMLEACDWCIRRLHEAHIPVTPRIEAYRTRLFLHTA